MVYPIVGGKLAAKRGRWSLRVRDGGADGRCNTVLAADTWLVFGKLYFVEAQLGL